MLKDAKETIFIDSETFGAMIRQAFPTRVKENRFNLDSSAGQRLLGMYVFDTIGRNRLSTCWGQDCQGRRFVARWYGSVIEVILEAKLGEDNFYVFDCDARMVA